MKNLTPTDNKKVKVRWDTDGESTIARDQNRKEIGRFLFIAWPYVFTANITVKKDKKHATVVLSGMKNKDFEQCKEILLYLYEKISS